MKFLALSLTLLMAQVTAYADEANGMIAGVPSWVDSSKKVVNFLRPTKLKVLLTITKASRSEYSIVNFSIESDRDKFEAFSRKVQSRYPSYQLQPVTIDGLARAEIEVPSLFRAFEVGLRYGDGAPFLNHYESLNKKETENLLSVIGSNDFAKLNASIKAEVWKTEEVERKSLPSSVCSRLNGSGEDLYSVLVALGKVCDEIDRMGIRYTDTKQMLKSELVEKCIDARLSAPVRTFADAFSQEVTILSPRTSLVGVTYRSVPRPMTLSYSPAIEGEVID